MRVFHATRHKLGAALMAAALGANPVTTTCANAGTFLYDFAGGMGKMSQPSAIFGSTAPSSIGNGFGLANTLLVTFAAENSVTELQFGLQARYHTGTGSDGNSYTAVPVYPLLRVQLSRLFFSGGATPFVWSNSGSSFVKSEDISLTYVGELGLLWPITPEFSFGAVASYQGVTSKTTTTPGSIIDGMVLMRFYFWPWESGKSRKSSNEYQGWRYPFGFFK